MKIFDLYETDGIKVEDPGLKKYINLSEKLVLKSHGRKVGKDKVKVNIIERMINLIGVPGHRGKKHTIQTSWATGKYSRNTKILLDALKIIKEKTGKNPIQILVNAIEHASPRDEITVIEYGGARYPQAVDMSPIRRINVTLRNLIWGAYNNSFGKKIRISEALAKEIMLAAESSPESFAMGKKKEFERQADSAR